MLPSCGEKRSHTNVMVRICGPSGTSFDAPLMPWHSCAIGTPSSGAASPRILSVACAAMLAPGQPASSGAALEPWSGIDASRGCSSCPPAT